MTDPELNFPKMKTKFIASDSTKNPTCFSGNQLDSYLYGKKTVLPIDVEEMRQKSVASGGESEDDTACSQGKPDGQCTTHDPLQSLYKLVHAKDQANSYDEIQHTYSVTSFPDEVQLCGSSIPGINYGVCAKQHLPSGTWIGPYEGRRTVDERLIPKEDHECRWEIYDEGRFSHFIDGSDYSTSSWMRFICSARSAKEQNMAAYQYGQNIYYRSIQDIPVGEELLVWYSDSYLKHLGIPMVLKETEQLNIDESIQHSNDWNVASNHPGTLVSKPPSTRRVTSELPSSEFSEHIPKTVEQAHDPKFLESTARNSSQTIKSVVPPTIQQTLANQIRERRERLKSLSEGPTATDKQELSENSPRELAKFSFSETAHQESYPDNRNFKTAMEDNSLFETSVLSDLSSPFKCKQCFKVFTQRIQLQMHVCPKAPYKPFQCGHCSSSFAHPSELRNHVVIHTSERPFKCGFCGRSFAGATTLNNHMRTHTGEKPFSCNKCGKTFSIATQLARHARMQGECASYTHFDSA